MQEQSKLLKEQDQELDKLHDGIKRVKALGGIMKDELDEQNMMLEELEEDVDRANEGMQGMQKKMKGLLEAAKNSDKAMYTAIGCLSLLLIALTFMVLS